MSEMSCKTCRRWAAGWCLAQQLGTSRDEVCNAWELSRVVEWEDENEKLQARIAELEAAQRWIPVSERLPEPYTRVLTISKDNNEPVTAWLEDDFWWSSVDWSLSITHWMPLPQPPEVQE